MPTRAVISLSAAAISSACARLSSAQGPAISASGSVLPKRTAPIETVALGFWLVSKTIGPRGRDHEAAKPPGQRGRLHQPALLDRRADERGEQRMRLERSRFQLGVELHADEPGMVVVFDDLGPDAVGRHAGETHAALLEPAFVAGIDLCLLYTSDA